MEKYAFTPVDFFSGVRLQFSSAIVVKGSNPTSLAKSTIPIQSARNVRCTWLDAIGMGSLGFGAGGGNVHD